MGFGGLAPPPNFGKKGSSQSQRAKNVLSPPPQYQTVAPPMATGECLRLAARMDRIITQTFTLNQMKARAIFFH